MDSVETALKQNTASMKAIEANTNELVQLIRGAKGLRSFVVWVSPLIAAVIAVWAYIKAH